MDGGKRKDQQLCQTIIAEPARVKGSAAGARYTPVLDLERRLRCRECETKGHAIVSVKWAETA